MTKYFLNSGGLTKNPEKTAKFFRALLDGFGQEPKLLICLFAQPREDWEGKFAADRDYFREKFKSDIKPQ